MCHSRRRRRAGGAGRQRQRQGGSGSGRAAFRSGDAHAEASNFFVCVCAFHFVAPLLLMTVSPLSWRGAVARRVFHPGRDAPPAHLERQLRSHAPLPSPQLSPLQLSLCDTDNESPERACGLLEPVKFFDFVLGFRR